jgi:hypothetical protein
LPAVELLFLFDQEWLGKFRPQHFLLGPCDPIGAQHRIA